VRGEEARLSIALLQAGIAPDAASERTHA